MGNVPPEPPSPQGEFRTLRSQTHRNLLDMATELVIARFIISRCLYKLDLVELLDVFSEVAETLDGPHRRPAPRLITPRDQNRS